MSPRPILKHIPVFSAHPLASSSLSPSSSSATETGPFPLSTCSSILPSPHVHFPPTPNLSSTHAAYSPSTYDRAPIEVVPNTCALPKRCGRMYIPVVERDNETLGRTSKSRCNEAKGSYFHPQAYEACECEYVPLPPTPTPIPPMLVHGDTSFSESDDLDEIVRTPPPNPQPQPLPIPCTQEELELALSFLPYPPSPVKDKEIAKARRRNHSPGTRTRGDAVNSSFAAPALDGCLGGF